MLQVEQFRQLAAVARNMAAVEPIALKKAELEELALDYERKARNREIQLILEAGKTHQAS
jgi:hypothetical protein